MKRIRNMAKIIHPPSLGDCERSQQVQKLVSSKVMEPCPKTGAETTSYVTLRPVTVKVCSRKDMERTCPPKLCDCPEESTPKRSKFMRWMMYILKGSVAAGLVYWTTSEGVWGDSDETEDLYHRIINTVSSALPDSADVNNLPRVEKMKYLAAETYNRGVVKMTNAIATVPIAIQNKIDEVLFPRNEEVNNEVTEDVKGQT